MTSKTLFSGYISEENDLVNFCDAITRLCEQNNSIGNTQSSNSSSIKLRQRALWLSLLQSKNSKKNHFELQQLPFLIKHPLLSVHTHHNNNNNDGLTSSSEEEEKDTSSSLFTASISLYLEIKNGENSSFSEWHLPYDFESVKTCQPPPACWATLSLSNIRFACKEIIMARSKNAIMITTIIPILKETASTFWINTAKLFNDLTHDP